MTKTIIFEAQGSFPFTFYIEKAVATTETEEAEKGLFLEGVASTTNVDHDNERMSKEALQAMVNVINEKGVPLRVEHSKSENAIIGSVFKAWLDERNQMHIRASLDKSHPVSPILHDSMKNLGKKMGFSVGGLVKRALRELSPSTGKLVKTFYDVELKEVSVTPRPANYDSWAVSKSIAASEAEAEETRGTFYGEFLMENPQLDYLQTFAKSVPDSEWRKTSPSINKNKDDMTTETESETKKAGSESESETEKAVTRSEFKVLVKGIETLAKAVEALATGKFSKGEVAADEAKDQANPMKDKPKDESPTAKAAEMDGEPHDQNAPAKDKPKDESPTAKAGTRTGQENGGEETEGSDLDGKREKATKRTDDTYDIETVTRSITSMESLTKRLKGVKKTETDTETETKKADSESETETETKKNEGKDEEYESETQKAHPLDIFVATVAKTLEAMVDKMEKSGYNILGFEKSMVDKIKDDPALQKEIASLLKLPGFKKSVSFGTPYMTTKEGRRYPLIAVGSEESIVEKSHKEGAEKRSFKDLYKSEYSSIRQDENG